MDDIPPLSPPQNEISTTPQSIDDYSPVEHIVSHREHFTTVTSQPNLMQSNTPIAETIAETTSSSTTTTTTTTTTANLGRDDTIANLLESSPSPSPSIKSINSIATFDDNDEFENSNLTFNDSQIDDSDLFEHYNGSISDLATENINSSNLTSTLPSPKSPTPLIKTRKQEIPIQTSSRTITPLHQNQQEILTTTTLTNRINSLESDLTETETKYYKIEREIICVDDLLNKLNDRHSVEFKKLNYAREKLIERLLTAKKDRYTIGIKLNKLRKKLYGDNGGDMTEYFARKVSI